MEEFVQEFKRTASVIRQEYGQTLARVRVSRT